jgi:hypothetical protein
LFSTANKSESKSRAYTGWSEAGTMSAASQSQVIKWSHGVVMCYFAAPGHALILCGLALFLHRAPDFQIFRHSEDLLRTEADFRHAVGVNCSQHFGERQRLCLSQYYSTWLEGVPGPKTRNSPLLFFSHKPPTVEFRLIRANIVCYKQGKRQCGDAVRALHSITRRNWVPR